MVVFIYGLFCPLTDRIRYIGKTVNPRRRLAAHVSAARRGAASHHTAAWIRQLLAAGEKPVMRVIDEIKEGGSWQEIERFWIAQAEEMGWALTNSTAGGEGLDLLCPIADAAYRAKLSAAHKVIWNTPERREEARQRSLAAWANPEVTARRKASICAAKVRPETIARYRAAALDIASRPEARQKKSESIKVSWEDPETRQKRMDAYADPAVKAKQSESKIALWQDPEGRAKMLASYTPERRAHQAKLIADQERQAKINAARNSPEYKAKRAATIRAKHARTPEQEIVWREERLAKRRDKRAAQKAAKLAATTSAPYTESS